MTPRPPGEDPRFEPLPLPATIEGVAPNTMAAFLALQKLVNTHQQLVVKDLSAGGTQPSQVVCLRLLATRDGVSQREIADAMRISRARVTNIVQGLERAGAVYRVRDEGDQRLTRVFLTELGRAIDQEKGSLRAAHISQMFEGMSDKDLLELRRVLDGLSTNLQRAVESNGAAVTPKSE